jgi:acyl carrier protein
MAQYDIAQVVRAAVADTLGTPELPTDLDARLVDDLGLESLDLLDILFRIECRIPVRLPMTWLSEVLQGQVPDGEFCTERGVVTDRGLHRLREILPQLDPARWTGRLRVEHIPSLVTVGNLVDMVRARAGIDEATSLV